MLNGSGDYLNIWLFFWPVLALVSFIAYFVVAKRQGKKVGFTYPLLILGALLVWAAVLLLFKY